MRHSHKRLLRRESAAVADSPRPEGSFVCPGKVARLVPPTAALLDAARQCAMLPPKRSAQSVRRVRAVGRGQPTLDDTP